MTSPQPNPAPSFIPAGRRPDAPYQASPRPADPAFTYTVIAPGQLRPLGPPPRPMAPPPPRAPLVSAQVTRVLLTGASLVAVVLGVTVPGPLGSGWDVFPAWSIFAVVSGLAVLAGAATEHREWSWRLQLYGALGLLLSWLIAGWPIAVSNAGCLLTVGVAVAVLGTLRNPFRPPWRAVFASRAAARR